MEYTTSPGGVPSTGPPQNGGTGSGVGPLPANGTGERGPPTPQANHRGKHHRHEDQEEGKLFVGGLSWETTQDTLLQYFSKFGDVIDCVVMKNVESGRSRGFGFVTFSDPANMALVLSASVPHTLDGRTIDPKPCNPRSMQRPRKNLSWPKVFLGGLPSNITETELRNFFSRYGKVMEVVIMYDQEKKKARGFGFLSFETEAGVEQAVAEHYINIQNKQVEIKRAEPRHSGTEALSSGPVVDQWSGAATNGLPNPGPAGHYSGWGPPATQWSSPAQSQHGWNSGPPAPAPAPAPYPSQPAPAQAAPPPPHTYTTAGPPSYWGSPPVPTPPPSELYCAQVNHVSAPPQSPQNSFNSPPGLHIQANHVPHAQNAVPTSEYPPRIYPTCSKPHLTTPLPNLHTYQPPTSPDFYPQNAGVASPYHQPDNSIAPQRQNPQPTNPSFILQPPSHPYPGYRRT